MNTKCNSHLLRSLLLWMRLRGRLNWRPLSASPPPPLGIAAGASMSTSTPSSRPGAQQQVVRCP